MTDLNEKIAVAHQIIHDAIQKYKPVATISLLSGGRDSTVSTALSSQYLSHAAHINTGIGIPETSEYVQKICKDWMLPYIELVTPPETYFDIIRRGDGFPGYGVHYICYRLLKERRLEELRRIFVQNPRQDRVLFITGVRASESTKRMRLSYVEPCKRKGSTVWVNPIVDFSTEDVTDYNTKHNLPRNSVVDLLHISGECLCGAYARPDELKEIEMWFPHVGRKIRLLEDKVKRMNLKRCEWGWSNATRQGNLFPPGILCAGCK